MARALKFGLSVSWPILAAMFGQTWIASHWVSKMDTTMTELRREMEVTRLQNDARFARLEGIYFRPKEKDL